MTGFEPVTYALPRRCATTCATSATLTIIAQPKWFVKLFFKKILKSLMHNTETTKFRKFQKIHKICEIPLHITLKCVIINFKGLFYKGGEATGNIA